MKLQKLQLHMFDCLITVNQLLSPSFYLGGGGNDLFNPRKQVVTFFSQACLAGNCILISIY